MKAASLMSLLLPLMAASSVVGHVLAQQAPATLQQQQHSRKVLQPAGSAQQYGAASNDELLEQALAEMLATATQQQPRPPPAAGDSATAAAAAAAAAPQVRRCGTNEGSSRDKALAEQQFRSRLQHLGYSDEVLTAGAQIAQSSGANATVQEVPVFFHILQYKEDPDNTIIEGFITRTRITQQMLVLNRAYRGLFRFRVRLVQWYTTNNKILFQAAQDSATEKRIKSLLRSQVLNSSSIVSSRRANITSGTSLHVFTWAPLDSILGWATFPSRFQLSPENDGVVILHDAITGGGIQNFNIGHTLTHEVGHWLGALHTFQGACSPSATNGGDFVADTPAVKTPNLYCEATDSCPSLPGKDLINNFMDYTPDSCMTTFTPGQRARMAAQWVAYRAGN